MDLNKRVERMDEELQLVKNEIKHVLLEIQEQVLNIQNPFTAVIMDGGSERRAVAPERAVRDPQSSAANSDQRGPQEAQQPQQQGAANQIPQGGFPPGQMGGGGGAGPGGGQYFGPNGQQSENYNPSGPTGGPNQSRDESNRFGFEPDGQDTVAFSAKESVGPNGHHDDRDAVSDLFDNSDDLLFDERDSRSDTEEEEEGPLGEAPSSPTGKKSRATKASASDSDGKGEAMDLITLAGLAQWVDRMLRKGGKDYVEAFLDVSEVTGRLTKNRKDTMLTLVRLLSHNSARSPVSVKEVVWMLAQLDGLLGTGSASDARLLPFLLQDDLEVLPLIRP